MTAIGIVVPGIYGLDGTSLALPVRTHGRVIVYLKWLCLRVVVVGVVCCCEKVLNYVLGISWKDSVDGVGVERVTLCCEEREKEKGGTRRRRVRGRKERKRQNLGLSFPVQNE